MLTSSNSLNSLKDVFFCPEESNFYSHCIENMVLNQCNTADTIVEFGSGDGTPVVKSLLKTNFDGVIHGFELNHLAWRSAKSIVEEYQLSEKYIIHHASFFDFAKPKAKYLISNPPYLPASDNKIYQPLLHGGIDGAAISRQLLSLSYENVLLMLSSYSNPKGLIQYAIDRGYSISNFVVAPLTFGYYSSESKVKKSIEELRKKGMAFYSKNIYFLAGVLFKKRNSESRGDLSTELIQLMTSL